MSLVISYTLGLRFNSRHNFFFFNDTATTEIYTLSLHDALPISRSGNSTLTRSRTRLLAFLHFIFAKKRDRKSTRLNSSHTVISYAVFCLKKKNKKDAKKQNDNQHTLVANLKMPHICFDLKEPKP